MPLFCYKLFLKRNFLQLFHLQSLRTWTSIVLAIVTTALSSFVLPSNCEFFNAVLFRINESRIPYSFLTANKKFVTSCRFNFSIERSFCICCFLSSSSVLLFCSNNISIVHRCYPATFSVVFLSLRCLCPQVNFYSPSSFRTLIYSSN